MKNKGKKLSDYSWKRYLVSFLILVLLIGVLVVILWGRRLYGLKQL